VLHLEGDILHRVKHLLGMTLEENSKIITQKHLPSGPREGLGNSLEFD
jgi:hypothetical protein